MKNAIRCEDVEQTFRNLESESGALIAEFPSPIILIDPDMRIVWANDSAKQANPDSLGKHCYSAYYDRTKPCANCFARKSMRLGKVQKDLRYQSEYIAGVRYWESIALPLHNGNGDVNGVYIVFVNVNEHGVRAEALKESEEFSSKLLSNSLNPVIIFNPDMSINYANRAFEELTGFDSSELLGKKYPYPWWPKKEHENIKILRRVLKGKALKRIEHRFETKNGELIWVEINTAKVESAGKLKCIVSNWTDVTAQKRLRENIRLYAQDITKAQEEERKRISRELHDGTIQSLLCLCHDVDAIIGLQDKSWTEVSENLKRVRSKIESAAEEMRRFSHELRPQLLDRFGLVPSLELLISELDVMGKPRYHLEVSTNRRRLSPEKELTLFRIAQEALHNARKHGSAKKVVVRVDFYKKITKLQVIDDGLGFGLSENMGDFAHLGKFGIIGMKERASLIGGQFSISSIPGKGTNITVKVL